MQRLVRESSVTSGVTADVRKLLTALKAHPVRKERGRGWGIRFHYAL